VWINLWKINNRLEKLQNWKLNMCLVQLKSEEHEERLKSTQKSNEVRREEE
jgi:hypothetical protein